MFTLIVVVSVLGLAFLFISRSKKEKSGNWVQFFAKGKDSGFSFKEIELLRRLAARCNIDDPTSLFWSQNQLDICIRSMVRGIRMSGESEEQGTQDFLSKLYDYRKKIEMNKPQIKNGISGSRQIGEGQPLRILVTGIGVFKSEVVKNTSQYLTITRPVNAKISNTISWNGMKISVYFWREDDAGYVFDTDVTDEVFSKGISSLKIEHTDSLFRTQKRKSIRIKLHKAAFLYLAKDDDVPGKIEMAPGLKCFLEDLSDTGCAVTVGGQAAAGLRVKIQFALDNTAISMLGTVRSVDFRQDTNRTVLHVEADPLPMEIRNQILGEVFGMLPEDDEDELPFRVLDDEAAGISAQVGPAAPEDAAKHPETANE
ncbi:pilus assembly protein PilZ [Spirochaetia bacterium]|nr:pilus assembly protein PilZ [Spirochaetia bacterium]